MLRLNLFFWLILCLPATSFPGTSGKVVGRVVDSEDGKVLAGANVFLEGTTLGAATDLEGNFRVLNVPPGTYTLIVSIIGYKQVRYENVRVSIDLTTRVDFELESTVLEAGEVVTVIGQTPLVQMDLTSSSVSVSGEQIERLPVEDFGGVVALQAGVVEGHFRGGRTGEVLYMVDGIPINDVFSSDFGYQVENNAIQELEIISGTFNAEYGQAQSGVINVVTKEGGDHYSGQVSFYGGDYVSGHDAIFVNVDDLDPTSTWDAKASLSGPVPFAPEHLSLYASGRLHRDDGYLYGKTVYNPSVIFDTTDTLPENQWEFVPMAALERRSVQSKLTYVIDPEKRRDKINLNFIWQEREFREYVHLFKYSPDGARKSTLRGGSGAVTWSHIASENTYWTLKGFHLQNELKSFAFPEWDSPLYASDDRLRQRGNFSFYTGGTDMRRFNRETRTSLAKFDVTSQIRSTHQLRGGLEAKRHRLELRDLDVLRNAQNGFQPQQPSGRRT